MRAVGGFAAACRLPPGLEDPRLVFACDGVGTKIKVAAAAGRHSSIGIDLVAMCVNDILCTGAEPIAFLDYFATSTLDVDVAEEVVAGIVEGCRQAGCELVGGETAEMPSMYAPGDYELAGFAVGVVERSRQFETDKIQAGDAVIGLPSSGLHSNGFSLARQVLTPEGVELEAVDADLGRSLADELLVPTKIYVDAMKRLREAVEVLGVAHITGGGLIDNPPRITSSELAWRLDTRCWSTPTVMRLIAERGQVGATEMRRTFNMGLGLLAVVRDADSASSRRCTGRLARLFGRSDRQALRSVRRVCGLRSTGGRRCG